GVAVAGWRRRTQMRVLEDADMSDIQHAIVGRQRDPERIPSNLDVADNCGEIVRLGDAPRGIDAGLNPRRVDDVSLEAGMIDTEEIPAVVGKRHVAWKGALEPVLRRGDHVEWTVERMSAAIQVHRSDDLTGDRICNPQVAVFAAGNVDALAVW